jgi:pimeloyl-ACP methyl ester carboxylesterase
LFGVSQAGWVAPTAAAADKRVRYLALITAPTVSTHEEGRWSRLRGDHGDEGDPIAGRAEAESILDTLTSKGVDARNYLSVRRIPGLWLFGSDDNSIPTKKSVRVLDSLSARGFPYEWRVYAGHGHGLIGRQGAMIPRIAPESWNDLLDWLERTATMTAANSANGQNVIGR